MYIVRQYTLNIVRQYTLNLSTLLHFGSYIIFQNFFQNIKGPARFAILEYSGYRYSGYRYSRCRWAYYWVVWAFGRARVSVAGRIISIQPTELCIMYYTYYYLFFIIRYFLLYNPAREEFRKRVVQKTVILDF